MPCQHEDYPCCGCGDDNPHEPPDYDPMDYLPAEFDDEDEWDDD